METNQGPRREGEREGEDTVEKRWRGTDDYRSGGVASIADDYRPPFTPTTWMDPDPFHFVHYVFLFYLSLPPLAPKRWRKLCRCTTLIFHSSSMDRSIDPSSLLDSCDSNQIEIRRKTLSRSSLLIICIPNVDTFIIYCNFQRWSINRTSQCITSFPIIWIK